MLSVSHLAVYFGDSSLSEGITLLLLLRVDLFVDELSWFTLFLVDENVQPSLFYCLNPSTIFLHYGL